MTKEIKFYIEDLCFDPDELEEAIQEELKEMGIVVTRRDFNVKIIVDYETQENNDE